jgi:Zn-dependent protease with chaperone function
MSRAVLVISVALSSYAVISTIAAIAVAAAWCAWRPSALLRLSPAIAGFALTIALVMPGYLAFEEPSPYEDVGPLLIALTMIGLTAIGAGLAAAFRAAAATWRIERRWMRAATAVAFEPPAGVPAFVIDTATPVVALIGVLSPKLVVSRSVIEACSAEELGTIVSHERHHLDAHDNLKRWLIASAPDVLRWTPLHTRIAAGWHDAAEDAADDAASGQEALARANLAALLLKVARLAPAETYAPAMMSPFADMRGLDRRVRRLLADGVEGPEPVLTRVARAIAIAATVVITVVVTNRHALEAIHEIVESVVGFGR